MEHAPTDHERAVVACTEDNRFVVISQKEGCLDKLLLTTLLDHRSFPNERARDQHVRGADIRVRVVVDGYFPVLDGYGELTETLERTVIEQPDPKHMTNIHLLKRELLEMRRALWSQREAIATVLRGDSALIPDALRIYLRDCSDHSFHLLDMIEVYREISQRLVDLHLSSVSHRMNEIIKALTVIATIFIPMTFLSGRYGMNFDTSSPYNLPELGWRFGYYYAVGLMATSTGILLFYFWRKGWLRKS